MNHIYGGTRSQAKPWQAVVPTMSRGLLATETMKKQRHPHAASWIIYKNMVALGIMFQTSERALLAGPILRAWRIVRTNVE
jgi:hypothetical protein